MFTFINKVTQSTTKRILIIYMGNYQEVVQLPADNVLIASCTTSKSLIPLKIITNYHYGFRYLHTLKYSHHKTLSSCRWLENIQFSRQSSNSTIKCISMILPLRELYLFMLHASFMWKRERLLRSYQRYDFTRLLNQNLNGQRHHSDFVEVDDITTISKNTWWFNPYNYCS